MLIIIVVRLSRCINQRNVFPIWHSDREKKKVMQSRSLSITRNISHLKHAILFYYISNILVILVNFKGQAMRS